MSEFDIHFVEESALAIAKRNIGNIEHDTDFCGREDTTLVWSLEGYTFIGVLVFFPIWMHLAAFNFMLPLSEMPNHSPALVLEVLPGKLSPRLVEMGIFKGVVVKVLFRAPFSGPIAVDLGSSVVSLRMDEAALVQVELMKEAAE
jgi:Fe2+ transport system protein FeoA